MMSLPKRYIEIDPSTPFEEVTKLLGDSSEEVEVKSGPELFVIHRSVEQDRTPEESEPELFHGYPIIKTRMELDEDEQRAFDAMLEVQRLWRRELVIDERTGLEVYRAPGVSRRFDPQQFLEAAEELSKLVDWDWVEESIEESRRADVARDRELFGENG